VDVRITITYGEGGSLQVVEILTQGTIVAPEPEEEDPEEETPTEN